MPSELHTDRRDSTLVLTISDPGSRNTLSEQVFAAGVEALEVVESDPEVRCIVLRGDGDHFCAGGNLQKLHANRKVLSDAQDQLLQRFHDFIEVLRVFPKPVIAAVEGTASGAGFALALGCDLIVAAENAEFSFSQGLAGLSPDGGASWHLMQRVPRGLVLQWMWLSESITAQQLHTHGLVHWLSGHGRALDRALQIGARLAQCAPNAVASTKELINHWPERSLGQQLDAERTLFLDNLSHANGGEGLQAFLEQRPPHFR